jgi:hypothetical protein
MLTYVRRVDYGTDRIMPPPVEKKAVSHPIVGYCNWSYSKNHQIAEEALVAGFQSYQRKMLPYYVRIFNETPIEVAVDFFTQKGITKKNIQYIFNKSLENSGIRLNDSLLNTLSSEG